MDDCTKRVRVEPENTMTIPITHVVDVDSHVSWWNDWSIKVMEHSEFMETNHHRHVDAKALNQEDEKRDILCLDDTIVPTKATLSNNRCQQRVMIIKQIRMYRLHQGSSNHCSFIPTITLNAGNRTKHHCLGSFGLSWFVFFRLIPCREVLLLAAKRRIRPRQLAVIGKNGNDRKQENHTHKTLKRQTKRLKDSRVAHSTFGTDRGAYFYTTNRQYANPSHFRAMRRSQRHFEIRHTKSYAPRCLYPLSSSSFVLLWLMLLVVSVSVVVVVAVLSFVLAGIASSVSSYDSARLVRELSNFFALVGWIRRPAQTHEKARHSKNREGKKRRKEAEIRTHRPPASKQATKQGRKERNTKTRKQGSKHGGTHLAHIHKQPTLSGYWRNEPTSRAKGKERKQATMGLTFSRVWERMVSTV